MASLFDNIEPEPLTVEEIKNIHMIKDESNTIASGSFFIRGGKLLADIRIELDAKNPKYYEYHKKFKDLLEEAKKDKILISTSGI